MKAVLHIFKPYDFINPESPIMIQGVGGMLTSTIELDSGQLMKCESYCAKVDLKKQRSLHASRLREEYKLLRSRDTNFLERDVRKSITRYLDQRGIFWWPNHLGPVIVQGPNGPRQRTNPIKGFPDLSGIMPNSNGRMFAIEVKRSKGGKVAPEQRDWHAELRAQGVLVIVASHIDHVAAHL